LDSDFDKIIWGERMKCLHKDCDGEIIFDPINYDPPAKICKKCEQHYDIIFLCDDCGAQLKNDEVEGRQCIDCAVHEKLIADSMVRELER
jgi:hypothetical protein